MGLEAQQRDIHLYLENYSEVPWEIIGQFQDVPSGGEDDRLELRAALDMARRTGAELLVAKLDRLSRKVSFIAQLRGFSGGYTRDRSPHCSRCSS